MTAYNAGSFGKVVGDGFVSHMVLEAKEARKVVLERVRRNRAKLYERMRQKGLL